MNRVLITGGAGFLGSWLTERLLGRARVVGFGLRTRNALALTDLEDHPDHRFVEGDVLDAEALRRVLDEERPDVVVHLAARAGVSSYFRDPVETMRVNLLGTWTLLDALRDRPLDRLVLASTSEVFGAEARTVRESDPTPLGEPTMPRWSYGASKLAAEHLAFACRHRDGLPVTVVRPFNVYGPRQVGEGAIALFVERALAGEPLRVTGNGSQVRAWCWVGDFTDGLVRVLEEPAAVGRVVHLGNPDAAVSVLDLAEHIVRLSGSRSPIERVPHPGGERGEVRVRIPSIEAAAELLGFRPRVGLDEGLERTIAWTRGRLGIAEGAA